MAAIGIPFAACDEASRQTCLLVTHLTSNDILMGRGAPIAYFEGNIKFRELVKPRRADYSTATSQRRKHEIAMQIYAEVEQRNGRFLQKVAPEDAVRQGVPVGVKTWSVVEKGIALDKIKQALREKSNSNESPPFMTASPVSPSPQPRDLLLNVTSPNRSLHEPLNTIRNAYIHPPAESLHFGSALLHSNVESTTRHSTNNSDLNQVVLAGSCPPHASASQAQLVMLQQPKSNPYTLAAFAPLVDRPQQRQQPTTVSQQTHHQRQRPIHLQRNLTDLLSQCQQQETPPVRGIVSGTTTLPPYSVHPGLLSSMFNGSSNTPVDGNRVANITPLASMALSSASNDLLYQLLQQQARSILRNHAASINQALLATTNPSQWAAERAIFDSVGQTAVAPTTMPYRTNSTNAAASLQTGIDSGDGFSRRYKRAKR